MTVPSTPSPRSRTGGGVVMSGRRPPRRGTIGHVIELKPTPVPFGCDRCTATRSVDPADTRTPMHLCASRAGMAVPMIPVGERSEVRLIERADYLGSDAGKVRTDDNGRPFMRAEVERPSGQVDVWVYAPTATIEATA